MTTFVISDTHFYHRNIIKHCARPFVDVESMNRTMVEAWNMTVDDDDVVWHLGDVAMWKAENYEIVKELKGRKKLILGNHDTQPVDVYTGVGFERVYGSYEGWNDWIVLSHIPVHPSQLGQWKINLHGHIHNDRLQDNRYYNVCVEHTAYKPVPIDFFMYNRHKRRGSDDVE